MYCTRKINDDYTWVGADCRRLALFEGVFGVPDGISFNSYLLTDEKTVLFDTADSAVRRTFRENLTHALAGRELDYIVVHHMEPDHAAELAELAGDYPEAQLLCSGMAKTMVGQFFGPELAGRITVIKEGETLCTGRHTLRFVAAPMVHWPEVMMTYDETDRLLLTADAFGCFGALNGALFADEVDFDRDYLDEARRYYTNIVGKYGPQVLALLKKVEGLDVRMVCPLHGPIWRRDLGYLMDKYKKWASYQPEVRGVLIACASIYGGTETAAGILACRLAERGIPVELYDVSVTHCSYVLSDAFKYSHIVFASATYNNGIFTPMEELLRDIAHHALQDRTVALIQNGSWAPASGKLMAQILGEMKNMELLEQTVTLKSALAPGQDQELEALADALAASVRGEQEAPEQAVADAPKAKGFICKICGFIYESDTLPEDFRCPICGRPASDFEPVT